MWVNSTESKCYNKKIVGNQTGHLIVTLRLALRIVLFMNELHDIIEHIVRRSDSNNRRSGGWLIGTQPILPKSFIQVICDSSGIMNTSAILLEEYSAKIHCHKYRLICRLNFSSEHIILCWGYDYNYLKTHCNKVIAFQSRLYRSDGVFGIYKKPYIPSNVKRGIAAAA